MKDELVKEIVIGDDGSCDNSLSIIERMRDAHPDFFVDITTYPTENIGAHAMLNRLTERSNSEWIAVLNSDDMFAAARFSAIQSLSKVRDFDFCFGNIAIIDHESAQIGRKRAFLDPQYPFPEDRSAISDRERLIAMLICQNYIATTSNISFTKTLWERVGGFRNYRYAHDWDFAIRCMLEGTAAYVPEYFVLYRIHGSNTIKESRKKQDAEVSKIFEALNEEYRFEENDLFRKYMHANEYIFADI